MDRKVSQSSAPRHRVIAEIHPEMAKADLRKSESADSLKEYGECLNFARLAVGWTLDRLAREIPPSVGAETRDPRQVQRWIDGKERVQIDAVFAVPALKVPFIIALARLARDCQDYDCEEETTLRFRRRA